MVAFIGHIHGLEFSLPSVLRSCGKVSGLEKGRKIHAQVLKTYFHDDPFVLNSILHMYLGLGEIEIARRVFDRMPHRDVISWNSMISGCFKAGESGLACRVFAEMPHKDLVSINTMVDGLMKCGSCHLAMVDGLMQLMASVMIGGTIHEFLVGKNIGIKCSEVILAKLEEVTSRLKMEGFRPDLSQDLIDVEEGEKENFLGIHSEKLAIAFGLVKLEEGGSIHILKNLRVCGDCH